MTAFEQFEQQVHDHQNQVYGFACSMLRDEVTAQDVTQDVFIKLWEHREDVDYDRALPWLMRVTRNACIDQLRRRQTRQKTMTVDTEGLSRAESERPLPDTRTEISDFEDHLNAALDQIDEPYRSVVVLREIQELKYQEIADALDMPLNTVKVYIHRGRKKLRTQLSNRLDYVPA
jgi:RNA polymerase sigma-70 factor (ECF subfamily)